MWRLYPGRLVLLVLAAMLGMWVVLRAERTFNQAYNDYQDFKAMRAWILTVQANQPRPSAK